MSKDEINKEITNEPSLTRGDVRVSFVYCDEGYHGGYDPEDPDDDPLLRMDVEVREEMNYPYTDGPDGSGWETVSSSSYCTGMPTYTEMSVLNKALEHIMDAVHDPLTRGEGIKRTCQSLSWISPDDEVNWKR